MAENFIGCRAELCKIIDWTNTINEIKKAINTTLINSQSFRMNVVNKVKKNPHNNRYAGKLNTTNKLNLLSCS